MQSKKKTLILCLFSLILLLGHSSAQSGTASSSKTSEKQTKVKTPESDKNLHLEYEEESQLKAKVKLNEVDRLRMDNIRLKQQLTDSQLQTQFQVWLQDPKIESMSKLSKGLKDDLQTKANEAYAKYKLKPEEYDLDLEHGAFVPKSKD